MGSVTLYLRLLWQRRQTRRQVTALGLGNTRALSDLALDDLGTLLKDWAGLRHLFLESVDDLWRWWAGLGPPHQQLPAVRLASLEPWPAGVGSDTLYVLWRALLLTDLLLLRYWITGEHVLPGRLAVLGGISAGLRDQGSMHAPTFARLFEANATSDDVLHQEGCRLAEVLSRCSAGMSAAVVQRKAPALIPLLGRS